MAGALEGNPEYDGAPVSISRIREQVSGAVVYVLVQEVLAGMTAKLDELVNWDVIRRQVASRPKSNPVGSYAVFEPICSYPRAEFPGFRMFGHGLHALSQYFRVSVYPDEWGFTQVEPRINGE